MAGMLRMGRLNPAGHGIWPHRAHLPLTCHRAQLPVLIGLRASEAMSSPSHEGCKHKSCARATASKDVFQADGSQRWLLKLATSLAELCKPLPRPLSYKERQEGHGVRIDLRASGMCHACHQTLSLTSCSCHTIPFALRKNDNNNGAWIGCKQKPLTLQHM